MKKKSELTIAFEAAMASMGYPVGYGSGEYYLDFFGIAGGYIIEQKRTDGSGIRQPFHRARLPRQQMIAYCRGIQAAAIVKNAGL